MINAYARNGMRKEGIAMLQAMTERGLKPDDVTFLCALNGCNHTGLVEEGRIVFESMKSLHGVDPDRRHFSCTMDLFCRAGLLHETEEFLLQSQGKGEYFMWSSLLRSCRVHKNEEVGTKAAQVLVELDPDDPAVWLQASNFYAEIGKFDASRQIREGQNMDKFFLVSLLALLITAYGVAGSIMCDNIGMLEELKSLEALDIEEEENEVELSDIPSWRSERGGKVLVNIDSFGAAGDGESDDTEALQKAWGVACSTPKSVLLIPQGRRYLVNATRFKGPCADKLIIQIDGTLVAPDEPKNWDPKLPRVWLDFSKLNKTVFQGSGVIDGSGSKWWAASCKKNKSNPCKGAPTAFTIDTSSSIRVKGLTIQNSQQMHFTISRCDSVRITSVKVSAPGDSPNTDGIHISESTNVIIQDSKIGTGDDCISIVNASSNIKMKRIYCGPGHGISIGSLGKNNSTGIVTKVILDTAVLRETTNGVRIKTWQGGSGYVRGVRFQNVRVENVSNPIIIDQFYCDSPTSCENQTTAVEISEVMYQNISGTTMSAKAIKFDCSDSVPCNKLVLSNVDLEKQDGSVETYCHSAQGFPYGVVHPSADCLSSSDKTSQIEESTTEEEDIRHIEL
ncbi:putative polygalacturonase [Glycine max]|nr:putative polygalacturonase [Glycine max]